MAKNEPGNDTLLKTKGVWQVVGKNKDQALENLAAEEQEVAAVEPTEDESDGD